MRSEEYFYTLVVLCALAIASTGLRFAARRAKKSRFGLDDGFIVAANFVLLGLLANSGIMYLKGRMGEPLRVLLDEDKELVELFMKCFYASNILYFLCMLPTKLSILALYLRIWSAFSRVVLITRITIVITLAWFVGGILPTAIQCFPQGHTAWDLTPPPSKCLNMSQLFRAITISNLLTDCIVLIVPFFAIHKLKLSASKKVAIAGLFLMGGLAVVCELLRIVYQERFRHADLSTTAADCAFWTIAEPAVAIVAANLPCLKPLLPEHSPLARISGIFSSGSRGSGSSGALRARPHSSSLGSVGKEGKSWFGTGKKSGLSSTTRTMESDDEDAIPLTDRGFAANASRAENGSNGRGLASTRNSGGALSNGLGHSRRPSVSIKDKHSRTTNPYLTNVDNSCWSDSRPDMGLGPTSGTGASGATPRALSPPLERKRDEDLGGIYVKQEFAITTDERRDWKEGV